MKHAPKSNIAQVLGGMIFAGIVLVGVMFFAGFWTTKSGYTVSAAVSNARGIANDSTVFEAGLPVGLVTAITRSGPDAILTMRIDRGPTPLAVDSTIQLGLRSLAGEADVMLVPGKSKQMVRNGGSFGLSQDQDYTEVDQILNSFAGPAEGKTRELFQGLGTGLAGEGKNLNNTIGGAAAFVNDSLPLTSALSAQRTQVADIVQSFGTVMNAIGQRSTALKQFAQGELTTFNAVSARDSALKATLSKFPAMMTGVQRLGTSLATNAPPISAMATHLATVARRLQPTINLLGPGASNGTKVLTALGSSSPQLTDLLTNLTRLEPSAAKALPAVHAVTCQANPMIRFIAPYGSDIAAFFENFGGATTPYFTAGGHPFLANVNLDPTSLIRGVTSQPALSSLDTLVRSGLFTVSKGYQYYRPITPPGERNSLTVDAGSNTPAEYGATHKYPHITQDCSK